MKLNNKIKLTVYQNERIIIENYTDFKDISDNNIMVDIYQIKGQFLKLIRMNDYLIEIKGNIKEIMIMP